MRNTVAKRLRKVAAEEMLLDKVPNRDLVMGRNSVVNSPQSVRAMYLKLKAAWHAATGQHPVLVTPRQRAISGWHVRANLKLGYALIKSPLKQLAKLFPDTTRPDGTREQHPVVRQAYRLSSQGDGKRLQSLAQNYL